MIRAAIGAAVLLIGWSADAGADVVSKVKAGKIVTVSVPETGGWPGRAMGVVQASADEVFEVLRDFTQYQQFVPRVYGSRHLHGRVYELRARFPWPVNETRVEVEVSAGKRGATRVIKWAMTRGSLKRYEGVAWIQPWGKHRCLVTYQMLAVPKGPAPGGLMAQGLRKAAAGVVAALRKRVALVTAGR